MDEPDHEYFNPGLRECVDNLPQLGGCEAAYYFPTDLDVCAPTIGEEEQLDADEGKGTKITEGGAEPNAEIEGEGSQQRVPGAGNLVVHVRSGDIFREGAASYHVQVTCSIDWLIE